MDGSTETKKEQDDEAGDGGVCESGEREEEASLASPLAQAEGIKDEILSKITLQESNVPIGGREGNPSALCICLSKKMQCHEILARSILPMMTVEYSHVPGRKKNIVRTRRLSTYEELHASLLIRSFTVRLGGVQSRAVTSDILSHIVLSRAQVRNAELKLVTRSSSECVSDSSEKESTVAGAEKERTR
uniref:Uncharacterized protein n=1 Tax=Oryza punctata TaxID=4537 RepID=A0A0E0KE30_ORYPU